MERKAPFPFDDEARTVMRSYMRDVQTRLEARRNAFVDSKNVHHFSHGTSWQSHNSYDPDRRSELQTQSHEASVLHEDVIIGRLEIISESMHKIVTSLIEGFERTFISTLSDVCEENDRVLRSEGSIADRYLEALDSVDFSVGRDGTVQVPHMIAGGEDVGQLVRASLLQSPDLQARFKLITALKSEQALERESSRKAKFVKEEE